VSDSTDASTPAEAAPSEAADSEAPVEGVPARRRRGWLVPVIVVGVVLVLGVVGFLVADAAAAATARDYVKTRITEVLGLPADTEVDVDLGGGSMLLQLQIGRAHV
jgi:hypothetical protein